MTPSPNGRPKDLIEALAVSPQYHLFPKREINPLLSFFSTNHPSSIPLTKSDQRKHAFVEKAMHAMNEDPDAYKASIDCLLGAFGKAADMDLGEIKFRKPVIASEGGSLPDFPTLPALQLRMLESIEGVENEDLVEPNSSLEMLEVDPPSVVDLITAGQYDELIAMEMKKQETTTKRGPSTALLRARKRTRVDVGQLADSTIASIVGLIDKVDAAETEAGYENCLGKNELKSLLHHLTRLSEAKRLKEVPSDFLHRIEQLCLSELVQADNSSKKSSIAARIILLIISTKGLETRLYSEALINGVVSFTSKALSSSASNAAAAPVEDVGMPDISKLLLDLDTFVSHGTTDERVLTKLEYCCLEVVFGKETKQDSALTFASLSLLETIFRVYDHQRRFLIHETLSNMPGVSEQDNARKRINLTSGASLSAFTVLLLKFVHCIEFNDSSGEIDAFMRMSRSNSPQAPVNLKRRAVLENLAGEFSKVESWANMISSFCLEKLTASEAKYKQGFFSLLEDLLAVLRSPEYPGAWIMLSSLFSHITKALNNTAIPTAGEPLALDVLGLVSIDILKLKGENSVHFTLSNHLDLSELEELEGGISQLGSVSSHSRDFISLLALTRLLPHISKASSGLSQHGFFRSSPDKKTHASELEVALHEATDSILLSHTKAPASDQATLSVFPKLMYGLTFGNLYEEFLAVLMQCLDTTKARLGTKAIKVLSSLIDIDTDILKMSKVSASISKLLGSNAASSREAIIELLAKYISSRHELLERYYKPVCARVADESVAVRKRVLRIIKAFVTLTNNVEIRVHISSCLLKAFEDAEEVVREHAKEVMFAIWLSAESKLEYRECAEVMMRTISQSERNQHSFEKYVASGLSDKKFRIKVSTLKRLADAALNIAVDKADTEEHQHAESALKLVSVFASLELDLLGQDQLISLQPYLTATDADNESCICALRILRLVIMKRDILQPSFVTEIQDAILKALTKYAYRELHEAVPILKILCDHQKNHIRLATALCSCLKLLKSNMTEPNASTKFQAKAVKLVQLLGCFAAFCNFEGIRALIEKSKVGLTGDETITSLVMRYILHFSGQDHPISLRSAAIRSMLLTCTHHPKMYFSKPVMKVLNSEFENGAHRMKLTILEGIVSFLQKEDRDLAKRNLDESCSSEKNLDIKIFHGLSGGNLNDGVCLTLIQGFIGPSLDLCLQDASTLSLVPVKFIEVVLKLGFVNPKICVPTIIALQASPNKVVRKIAFSLHKDIFNKHESLADRNYTEAFKTALHYSKKIYGEEFWKAVSFLRTTYRIVSSNFSSRKKLLLSLTRLFKLNVDSSDLSESVETRDTIVLLVLNLSVLPFQSLEEVCLTLYHLDRVITHEGIDLAEKVNSTVGASDDEVISVENLQLLFVHSQSVLALVYLRQTLSMAYAIPHSVMETYSPNHPDPELRQQPKAVTLIDYPLENLDMEVKLSTPGKFGSLFTKFVSSVKGFTM